MKKNMLSRSGAQDSITSVLAALLCVVIGLVGGYLVLLAINPSHAWGDGFVASCWAASLMRRMAWARSWPTLHR